MATLTIEHGASPVMQSKTIHNYTYVERKPHIKTITYDYDILTSVVGTRPTYNYTPLDPSSLGNRYDKYTGICYLETPLQNTTGVYPMYPLANDPIQFIDAGENSYYLAPTNPRNPDMGDYTNIDNKVRDVWINEHRWVEEDGTNHRTTTHLYLISAVQPDNPDHLWRIYPTVLDAPNQQIGQPNEFTHRVKFLQGNPPELVSFPFGLIWDDGPIPTIYYIEVVRRANWIKDGETWVKRQYDIRFDITANMAATKSATNVSDVFDGIQAWYLSGRSTLGYTAQLTEYNERDQQWDNVGNPSTGTVSLSSAPDPLIVLQQSGTTNVTNYNVSLSYEEVTT